MDLVGIIAVVALAALLVWREWTWRRNCAELRGRIAPVLGSPTQEQIAQMGQLVSFAQELKSPLQGVIGNTELMLATGGAGIDSTDELREIQENATLAAGLVRNLVAFTEASSLSCRWHNLNELAQRAVDSVRSDLQAAGIRVTLALADRLPLVYVDGRQLEKALTRLLSRPLPRPHPRADDVVVTVRTRRGDVDERLIIEIDDRVDTDFVQPDQPSWSGALVACRHIVWAHGGSLDVEQPASGGYRFRLELPVTAGGVP